MTENDKKINHQISNDIKEIESDLHAMWETVSNSIFGKQKTIQEVALNYGEACDKLIINSKKDEGLFYVAGKLNITKIDDLNFQVDSEFYFKNPSDKWIVKKTSTGKLKTNRQLSKDAANEINKKGKISFEIDEPN